MATITSVFGSLAPSEEEVDHALKIISKFLKEQHLEGTLNDTEQRLLANLRLKFRSRGKDCGRGTL